MSALLSCMPLTLEICSRILPSCCPLPSVLCPHQYTLSVSHHASLSPPYDRYSLCLGQHHCLVCLGCTSSFSGPCDVLASSSSGLIFRSKLCSESQATHWGHSLMKDTMCDLKLQSCVKPRRPYKSSESPHKASPTAALTWGENGTPSVCWVICTTII